jgi:hypothetical protein
MTGAGRTTVVTDTAAPVRTARNIAAGPALARLMSAKTLIRAAAHGACWIPFIACAADSWRGPWRAVGDGAQIALTSWTTFSAAFPLIGKSNELPGNPHDLGPLQFWLLAAPVHADPDRGVVWGAVLLAMLAASLTVEAAFSIRGETGGLLAAGVVVATLVWFPGFATWPFDNPNYGLMYLLAALSSCLAVLAGRRNWWPVLVVTASIAAQAYLAYVAASVGLVLIAAVVGLVGAIRAKGSYWWLVGGLIAAIACWWAPVVQQFTSPAGTGNMSLLLHDDTGRQVGFPFALKVLASLVTPSSLWWREGGKPPVNLYDLLNSKPMVLGLVVLAILAGCLVVAVRWLRSREFAGLAAISLLVGVTATATFAHIPLQTKTNAIGGPHVAFGDLPLIFVMFLAALLTWLTVICVTVAAAVKLINGRRERRDRRPVWPAVQAVAAVAIFMTALLLLGVRTVAGYRGSGTDSLRVNTALAKIERSAPRRELISVSVVSTGQASVYPVKLGLDWGLTGAGYQFPTEPSSRTRTITQVGVVLRGVKMIVHVRQTTCRPLVDPQQPVGHRFCAHNPRPHRHRHHLRTRSAHRSSRPHRHRHRLRARNAHRSSR